MIKIILSIILCITLLLALYIYTDNKNIIDINNDIEIIKPKLIQATYIQEKQIFTKKSQKTVQSNIEDDYAPVTNQITFNAENEKYAIDISEQIINTENTPNREFELPQEINNYESHIMEKSKLDIAEPETKYNTNDETLNEMEKGMNQ